MLAGWILFEHYILISKVKRTLYQCGECELTPVCFTVCYAIHGATSYLLDSKEAEDGVMLTTLCFKTFQKPFSFQFNFISTNSVQRIDSDVFRQDNDKWFRGLH